MKTCAAPLGAAGELRLEIQGLVSARKGLLTGMSEFLLFLFRVQELVAFRFTDKEPSHDCLGLRSSPIRESNRSFGSTAVAHSRD